MGISVINSTTNVGTIATGSNFAVNPPSGINDGDLVIAFISCWGDAVQPGIAVYDPGWSATIAQFNYGLNTYAAFWRLKNAGESLPSPLSFYDVNGNTTGDWAGGILVVRGQAASNPVDTYSTNGSATTGTTATALGITTGQNGCMLLALLAAHRSTSGNVTFATISGMTEKWDAGSGKEGNALDYLWVPTAGATGNKTSTISSSSIWGAMLVSIKAAAASGSVGLTAASGLTDTPAAILPAPLSLPAITGLISSLNAAYSNSIPLAAAGGLMPSLTGSAYDEGVSLPGQTGLGPGSQGELLSNAYWAALALLHGAGGSAFTAETVVSALAGLDASLQLIGDSAAASLAAATGLNTEGQALMEGLLSLFAGGEANPGGQVAREGALSLILAAGLGSGDQVGMPPPVLVKQLALQATSPGITAVWSAGALTVEPETSRIKVTCDG